MPLVQDQFRHKSYETELHLKLDTSKQLFADPKDIWYIGSNCDEDKSVSGNNSDVEAEDNVIYQKAHFKCDEDRYFSEQKTAPRKACHKQKNVRFEASDCSSGDDISAENEFSDQDFQCEKKGSCSQHEKRRCCSTINDKHEKRCSYDASAVKVDEDRCYHIQSVDCCGKHLRKPVESTCVKNDPRSKSISLDSSARIHKEGLDDLRVRRSPPKGKNPHLIGYCEPRRERCSAGSHDHSKTLPLCSGSREEEHYYGNCCNSLDELCDKTEVSLHALKHAKLHRYLHHSKRGSANEVDWKKEGKPLMKAHVYQTTVHQTPNLDSEQYQHSKELCHHILPPKQKKKLLDNYEKLPAVDESQEQFSDITYKKSQSTIPNLDAGDSLTNFSHNGDESKYAFERGPSWFYYEGKASDTTVNKNPTYDTLNKRIIKTRSRRTRMNRSRKNRWTQAYIHTVLEKSRNKIVGLMVMGPKGPEFYSRSPSIKTCCVPFRKSRSFPEGSTKSFLCLNDGPKEVGSALDPGPKSVVHSSDLIYPKEEVKVDEKVASFDRNIDELVKSSEQKFLHSLSRENFSSSDSPSRISKVDDASLSSPQKENVIKAEELEKLNNMKYPPFHKMPFESLSAKVPKSFRKNERNSEEVVAFNTESKALAENLNSQAKQFRIEKLDQKDDCSSRLTELRRTFPPKSLDKEITESNLTLWGMRMSMSSIPELPDAQSGGGKGDGNDSHMDFQVEMALKKSSDCGDHDRNKCEIHGKDKSKMNVKSELSEGFVCALESRKKKAASVLNKENRSINSRTVIPAGEDVPTKEEVKTEQRNDPQLKSSRCVTGAPQKDDKNCEESQSQVSENKSIGQAEREQMLFDMFNVLVQDGCAISVKQSENLQKVFKNVKYEADLNAAEACSTSSEAAPEVKEDASPRDSKVASSCDGESSKKFRKRNSVNEKSKWEKAQDKKVSRKNSEDGRPTDGYFSDSTGKKGLKSRHLSDDPSKVWKKFLTKQSDSKSKRRLTTVDKMKLFRKALPSMAAENEAAHLKQLKKYIHRFIDRAELKTSSSTEMRADRRSKCKARDTTSSDGSEVRVDAQQLIDLVSNPFKRITSDMTIDMAKKLTDVLVQESSTKSKTPKTYPSSPKTRKNSEVGTEDDASGVFPTTSGSDRGEEIEPIYLRQLKKMRNDHLGNIIMEVRRLKELLRFLDRCSRLKSQH